MLLRHRARHGGPDDPGPRHRRRPRTATCAACTAATSWPASSSREPGAGSDLASLQTKAERDGDEWLITGQKVWTSGAQYSDIGEIICRTDPDLPKHKGLTGFIVDMRAPGVEIRPLRQMTGGASFNEVFFNEVRVRDDHRLGDVNQGWSVALTTLMNERASIGAGGGGGIAGGMTPRIIEMVRHFGLDTDPIVRNELAALVTSLRVASYTNQRAMDKIKRGQLPGPELSIAKLSLTTQHAAHGRVRGRRARPPHRRRHRRVGHLRVGHVRPRRAGHAHRRRVRRGHAEHRRRARARPAQGPGHRLGDPVPRPEGRHPEEPDQTAHGVVTKPRSPAQRSRSRRSIAAASRSGNASGVQAKQGTPSAARTAARPWSCAGAPSSESASSTTQVTPARTSAATRSSHLARQPALEEVGHEDQHGVGRPADQPLAVREGAVDVGPAAELDAEQHVDRIVRGPR